MPAWRLHGWPTINHMPQQLPRFPAGMFHSGNCPLHSVNNVHDNTLTGITPGSNTAWQKLTALFCGCVTERYDADDLRKQIQQ